MRRQFYRRYRLGACNYGFDHDQDYDKDVQFNSLDSVFFLEMNMLGIWIRLFQTVKNLYH